MSPFDLLSAALAEPYGLALQVGSATEAKRLRRAIYSARDAARRAGIRDFEGLSVVLVEDKLKLLNRNESLSASTFSVIDVRPLAADEVPPSIGSRGKAKLSLQASLHVLAELGGLAGIN